jgi:hypothetical protein
VSERGRSGGWGTGLHTQTSHPQRGPPLPGAGQGLLVALSCPRLSCALDTHPSLPETAKRLPNHPPQLPTTSPLPQCPQLPSSSTTNPAAYSCGAGEDVVSLQLLLGEQGYLNLGDGITGYFGSVTKEALMNWQRDVGLPTTGVFTQDCKWAYLKQQVSEACGRQPCCLSSLLPSPHSPFQVRLKASASGSRFLLPLPPLPRQPPTVAAAPSQNEAAVASFWRWHLRLILVPWLPEQSVAPQAAHEAVAELVLTSSPA